MNCDQCDTELYGHPAHIEIKIDGYFLDGESAYLDLCDQCFNQMVRRIEKKRNNIWKRIAKRFPRMKTALVAIGVIKN